MSNTLPIIPFVSFVDRFLAVLLLYSDCLGRAAAQDAVRQQDETRVASHRDASASLVFLGTGSAEPSKVLHGEGGYECLQRKKSALLLACGERTLPDTARAFKEKRVRSCLRVENAHSLTQLTQLTHLTHSHTLTLSHTSHTPTLSHSHTLTLLSCSIGAAQASSFGPRKATFSLMQGRVSSTAWCEERATRFV